MDRKSNNFKTPHFHIQWSHKKRPDRKCYRSGPGALAHALGLAIPGDMFTIEACFLICSKINRETYLDSQIATRPKRHIRSR